MFAYACPFCDQRLLAPPERAGQRTICPKCLRPVTIPNPEQTYDPPSPPEPMAPPPSPEPPVDYRPARVTTATLAPRRSVAGDSGRIVITPTGVESADLAAELTAAIAYTMKPPPEPPSDLQLSTGAWLIMSTVGCFVWLFGLLIDPYLFAFVALIGVLQAAFGYIWAAYLVGRTNLTHGLITLLPPVGLIRIFRPFGDNLFRPLRFFLTGLLLIALCWIGPIARVHLDPIFATIDVTPAKDPPPATPADKLRAALASKYSDDAVAYLTTLTDSGPKELEPESKAEVVKLLLGLVGTAKPDVRSAAVAALVVWSPAEARDPVFSALNSTEPTDRIGALMVAAKVADPAIATAVAARFADRLADRREQSAAGEALAAIGEPAIPALIPHLNTGDDLFTLDAFDVLEKIGGPAAIAALTAASETTTRAKIRAEAVRRAKAIADRPSIKR